MEPSTKQRREGADTSLVLDEPQRLLRHVREQVVGRRDVLDRVPGKRLDALAHRPLVNARGLTLLEVGADTSASDPLERRVADEQPGAVATHEPGLPVRVCERPLRESDAADERGLEVRDWDAGGTPLVLGQAEERVRPVATPRRMRRTSPTRTVLVAARVGSRDGSCRLHGCGWREQPWRDSAGGEEIDLAVELGFTKDDVAARRLRW